MEHMTMASMQDPLAKLARAIEHVDSFAIESRSITDPSSYHIVHEFDENNGKQAWRFDSPTPVIPIRLNTIVGDALFNFRSALDQLVWQLVLANHAIPARHNSYPIVISHKFGGHHRKCLNGVSPEALEFIKGSQPQPGKNWELLSLPELNDIDKHQHLNLFVVSTRKSTLHNFEIKPGNNIFSPTLHFGRVEKGTILCTMPIEYRQVVFEPTFDIQLSESYEQYIPVSILTMLRSIEKSIRDIFAQLEREVNKK